LKKNRENNESQTPMVLEAKGKILTEPYVKIDVNNPTEFTTTDFHMWAKLIVQISVNNS
jgi:hypothetical protein